MKKVNIPYAMQSSATGMQLVMPPVAWPEKCLCCGSHQIDLPYTLEYKARYTSNTVGNTTTSNYYPLSWQVPLCKPCRSHVKTLENLTYIIIAACILLPIIIPIIFSFVSNGLLIAAVLLGCIILGVITYQVALHLFIRPKMNRTCSHHRYPLFASDAQNAIEFNFYNDQIADEFALINQKESFVTQKPDFWSRKRK